MYTVVYSIYCIFIYVYLICIACRTIAIEQQPEYPVRYGFLLNRSIRRTGARLGTMLEIVSFSASKITTGTISIVS